MQAVDLSSRAKGKRRLFATVTLVVSLVVATMHEPDAVLGWRNRPGSYVIPRYLPSGQDIHVTLEEPGRRRTRATATASPDGAMVLVGDSYAVGWALNDEDTFAWKLQERFPALDVLNYGTAGFGTYQSLLMLERVLPTVDRPRLVLHNFIEAHELRNAAPDSWLEDLARLSRRGHVRVPRATLDENGKLVRHPPEGYIELPFRERSALVNTLGRAFMHFRTLGRLSTKRAVTEQILLEMDRVAEKSGAELLVVLLRASPKGRKHYLHFLSKHGVAVVDCIREMTKDDLVPGEGHPNARMNTLWAECIAPAVAARLGHETESGAPSGEISTPGRGNRRPATKRRPPGSRGTRDGALGKGGDPGA